MSARMLDLEPLKPYQMASRFGFRKASSDGSEFKRTLPDLDVSLHPQTGGETALVTVDRFPDTHTRLRFSLDKEGAVGGFLGSPEHGQFSVVLARRGENLPPQSTVTVVYSIDGQVARLQPQVASTRGEVYRPSSYPKYLPGETGVDSTDPIELQTSAEINTFLEQYGLPLVANLSDSLRLWLSWSIVRQGLVYNLANPDTSILVPHTGR